MTRWHAICAAITDATGAAFSAVDATPVGGGCINEAWSLQGGGQRYFVKLNGAGHVDMFEAEAAGLAALASAGIIRLPTPVCSGRDATRAWLVLEFIALRTPSPACHTRLGEALADLHRSTAAQFGWARDNHIGATPQANTPGTDWADFFREQRLRRQLDLAAANGAPAGLIDAGQALLEVVQEFFRDYQPRPSLLHGDLWGGNWGADEEGAPVLFDPAVYYGDRETDLAMTELFGGFEAGFYRAYDSSWPLDPGYRTRRTLYNLYHVLNHYNLFGGGYARQAQEMARALLAEVS